MRRLRLTIRFWLIAAAVAGVEWLILMEAARIGPGVEFTLFIGSVLMMLDLLVPGYLAAADRLNRARPEDQAGPLLALGCLIVLMMLFLTPVVLVVLLGRRT